MKGAAFVFAFCLAAAALAQPAKPPALVPDAKVTAFTLDNGLRVRLLPHPHPKGRLSLYLLVEVGSYHEDNDERGFAHYVEHLAFNGTREFPQLTAIAARQRLGVSFGAHANATTSWFETEYPINNLPTTRPDALATSLRILRGFADGMTFDAREVRQERDVILSEMRTLSADFRACRSEYSNVNGPPGGRALPQASNVSLPPPPKPRLVAALSSQLWTLNCLSRTFRMTIPSPTSAPNS